jgi:hypothetical protein
MMWRCANASDECPRRRIPRKRDGRLHGMAVCAYGSRCLLILSYQALNSDEMEQQTG